MPTLDLTKEQFASLERALDQHFIRLQTQVSYWQTARDITTLYVEESKRFFVLLDQWRTLADKLEVLSGNPDAVGIHQQVKESVCSLVRFMEMWYSEILTNKDALQRREPYQTPEVTHGKDVG